MLKVLAEREKRIGSESVTSSMDELNEKGKQTAQHLLEEIRQAVSEANARGKNTPASCKICSFYASLLQL